MTSVHIRLLGCLEQYQTAEETRIFILRYINALRENVNSDALSHISR